MKHNHNHDNAPGPHMVPVCFEFTHPTAQAVCIAGTFNHWQPEAKPMQSMGAGYWLKQSALAPGTYEYCLVVDGQWMPDPLATESVANPFGGRNSILKVAGSPETRPISTNHSKSTTNGIADELTISQLRIVSRITPIGHF